MRTRPLPMILLAAISLGIVGVLGCGGPDSSQNADSSSLRSRLIPRERGDAGIRLREVFRRYQVCSHYRDDAVVTLRSKTSDKDGRKQTIIAPLRVEFGRGVLAVDAYAVRVRLKQVNSALDQSGEGRVEMMAWFEEVESSHFDSQVLRSAWRASANERVAIDRVLADEVLRSRLSAGLAGPPPQLEWLLAEEPMRKLFDNAHDTNPNAESVDCQWESDGEFKGDPLQRIAVTSNDDRFVFWIEPTTSLIRRVELPLSRTMGMVDPANWTLTLDLNRATFQPNEVQTSDAGGPTSFQAGPVFDPVFVRRFVPLPPPPPSPLLGRSISRELLGNQTHPYHVIAVAPQEAVAFEAWKHDWGVVLPVLASAAKLQLIVRDQAMASRLSDFPSPPVSVMRANEARGLMRKLRLDEGSMVLLDREGRVLLVEVNSQAGSIGNLISVIRDSVAGVDVPRRIRGDYERLWKSYQAMLEQARL